MQHRYKEGNLKLFVLQGYLVVLQSFQHVPNPERVGKKRKRNGKPVEYTSKHEKLQQKTKIQPLAFTARNCFAILYLKRYGFSAQEILYANIGHMRNAQILHPMVHTRANQAFVFKK